MSVRGAQRHATSELAFREAWQCLQARTPSNPVLVGRDWQLSIGTICLEAGHSRNALYDGRPELLQERRSGTPSPNSASARFRAPMRQSATSFRPSWLRAQPLLQASEVWPTTVVTDDDFAIHERARWKLPRGLDELTEPRSEIAQAPAQELDLAAGTSRRQTPSGPRRAPCRRPLSTPGDDLEHLLTHASRGGLRVAALVGDIDDDLTPVCLPSHRRLDGVWVFFSSCCKSSTIDAIATGGDPVTAIRTEKRDYALRMKSVWISRSVIHQRFRGSVARRSEVPTGSGSPPELSAAHRRGASAGRRSGVLASRGVVCWQADGSAGAGLTSYPGRLMAQLQQPGADRARRHQPRH
jgi:hypothetical protein